MTAITRELPPFITLNELKPAEALSIMYYGGAGTGKTFFLGTAGSRTLIIDTGKGIETLLSPLFRSKVGSNPIIVSVRERMGRLDAIPEIAVALDCVYDVISHAVTNFRDKFDTIAIDDMTEIRRWAMFKGLELNQQLGRSKSRESAQKSGHIVPAVQDYGMEMGVVEQFCVATTDFCRENSLHLIMAAHERVEYDKPKDKDGRILIGGTPTVRAIRPGFTGQTFPDDIPRIFDEVWHAEMIGGGEKGTAWRARIYGDEVISAKTRHGGVFTTVEVDPNFLRMLKRIKDAYAKS
jgi:hypothetical protein